MADRANNRLRKARIKCGKSQEYIADTIGITQPILSKYERAYSIASDYLILLADEYKVTTDYLLGRTEGDGICITVSEEQYSWIMTLLELTPEEREFIDIIKDGLSVRRKKKRRK